MSDFVRSRLNYYEMLRVSPTADGDEIDRAFAREGSVFRPHAFGGLTELCIAYETLRDPTSRRAYDAALRTGRDPTSQNRSIGARAERAPEIEASPAAVKQHAIGAPLPPASTSTPRQWPSPIAAPITPLAMKPALALGPGAELHTRPEQRIGRGDTPSLSIEDYLGTEVRPLDWRRAGITVGSIIVLACLLGGVAGWWSIGAAAEAPQPENTVSVSLSPAKQLSASPALQPAPEPVRTMPYAGIDRAKPKLATRPSVERRATASPAMTVEEQPEPIAVDAGTSHQAVEQTPEISPVAAAMPLPNKVVSRTIDRIGYACGAVSSAAPVEGEAPGTYKVTCTSGQSFQASLVNGRYRFKRWERR